MTVVDKRISELEILATVEDNDYTVVVDVSELDPDLATKRALKSEFKGDKGDQGVQGIQGIQGIKGDTGDNATATAGTTTTGNPGTNASVVNSGTTSDAVFDFTIPRGDVGAQGIQGIQGIQGVKGDKGDPGEVSSTGISVTDNITTFADATGDVIKDSGIAITDITNILNSASASAPASLDLHEDTDNGTNKITITAPSAVASDKVLTLPDETGTVLSSVSTLAGINKTPLYAPQGFLINGKISVTDAAGITVAIKTLAGTDPSATDPVYVRIGDTVRTISAALSVAKADGTNWMNAGSAELATKEIDYFVYLGYNATDGVVIGFSRIPSASQYSDFSVTTTNEKYAAISTITNATATDYYENIGRFAATLSAGAGYTWSVPTFTASNLIQRPIFETRSLVYLPTYAGIGSLTYTAVTTTVSYRIKGSAIYLNLYTNGTTGGTTNSGLTFTLPFAISASVASIGGGMLIVNSNVQSGNWYVLTSTSLRCNLNGGGNFVLAAGTQLGFNGFYQI